MKKEGDSMQSMHEQRRSRNLRTGILLATIAAAFFIGLLVKQYLLTHR